MFSALGSMGDMGSMMGDAASDSSNYERLSDNPFFNNDDEEKKKDDDEFYEEE